MIMEDALKALILLLILIAANMACNYLEYTI